MIHAGIGRSDYELRCRLLGIEPRQDASPLERAAHLPKWLTDELIATPAAQGRVRAWAAAGGLTLPDSLEARRTIVERVQIVGDDMLIAPIQRALERVPPPVLDHVRRNALVLAVGRSCGGFCVSDATPSTDTTEWRRLLVCAYYPPPPGPPKWVTRLSRMLRRPALTDAADTEFLGVCIHETAHHWLEPSRPRDYVETEAERVEHGLDREAYVRCAVALGFQSRLTKDVERVEYRACRLVRSWGFRGASADGEHCALGMRAAVMREAERAGPLPEEEDE